MVWCVCVHAHVCVWCVCGVYVYASVCVMSLAHLHFIPTLDQFDNFITLCPNEDLALKSSQSVMQGILVTTGTLLTSWQEFVY